MNPKTQRRLEDRELNHARSKPDTIDQPARTACNFVHHYNSTQYTLVCLVWMLVWRNGNINIKKLSLWNSNSTDSYY